MKRALVVYRVNKDDPSNHGVIKKMIGQVEGLKDCGFKADFVIHGNRSIYFNEKPVYEIGSMNSKAFFKWRWFDHLSSLKYDAYDLVIVRYGLSTPSFVRWLRLIKLSRPETKVIIDMPTYPYEQEWVGAKGWLLKKVDRRFSTRLRKYVDLVLHSGPEKSIFRIKTLLFSNGINLNETPIRRPVAHKGVRLVALGKWQTWHGMDRLIRGLNHYEMNGGKDVIFDIVGDGPARKELVHLVNTLKLGHLITFHQPEVGERLDQLMNQADLAIGTLGLHRKGVKVDSSLKHREYVAREIPFVYCGNDIDIDPDEEFVYTVPADDSPIDIKALTSFLDKYNAHGGAISRMRELAKNKLSWDAKMRFLCKHIFS